MNSKKHIAKTVLILLLAMLPAEIFAQTASGSTTVNITIPGRLRFEYYATVNVDIPAGVFDEVILGGGLTASQSQGATGTLTAVDDDGAFSVDADIDEVDLNATLTNVNLVIENVWSLTATRNGTVTPSITTGTLNHSGAAETSTIVMTAIQASSSQNATFANPLSFNRTGLGNAMTGNVQLTLDLSNANASGTYEGGVYELVVALD